MTMYKTGFVPRHIPYTLPWDKMPVDISWIFESEKPAGKHGFLTVRGNEFIFEDGTKFRFWGTNFNSGANFPSHSYSEKVARRLAMTGLNLVRLHQLDAEWATPNIFQFSKGKLLGNTLVLDPESMERLDYLIYCLKQEGIYIYMDFLTYRRFKEEDGIANADKLDESGRPYSMFNRRMIELQKKFAHDFLEHYNPYTGVAYKDDPVIALAEINNETSLFFSRGYTLEPYHTELETMYREYAAAKGEAIPSGTVDFDERDLTITQFLCKVQNDYYLEMSEYIRSIGARFPITLTNYAVNGALTSVHASCDFSDSHGYWWIGDQRCFNNNSMMFEPCTFGYVLAFGSIENKAFFVSEWDSPWPNQFRTDSTLLMAAIGGLQGWGGFTIHTYRYGTNENESVTGKLGRSIVLGSSYYRGTFDTYNDPAKFGLFYHAALITRRRDVRSAEKQVFIDIDVNKLEDMSASPDMIKPIDELLEKHCIRMAFPSLRRAGGQADPVGQHVLPDQSISKNDGDVLSDTGELYRNWKVGYGTINTPKTKVAYGFTGRAGALSLGDVQLRIDNDYATVAISSLTDDCIGCSRNMLLTAIGLADNKDVVYNQDHTILIDEGKPPIMIEVIEAEIAIRTSQPRLKVWSVDNEGFLTGAIPSSYEGGVFRFAIGKEFASMYYLIQAQ